MVVHHVLHEPYGGADTGLLSGLPWESGVDVFFVISGFVMVYSSSRLFAAPSGSRVFLRRRLARIVPLYWTATELVCNLKIVQSEIADEFSNWMNRLA